MKQKLIGTLIVVAAAAVLAFPFARAAIARAARPMFHLEGRGGWFQWESTPAIRDKHGVFAYSDLDLNILVLIQTDGELNSGFVECPVATRSSATLLPNTPYAITINRCHDRLFVKRPGIPLRECALAEQELSRWLRTSSFAERVYGSPSASLFALANELCQGRDKAEVTRILSADPR